jgi:2,3-bisphosphoglycerate-dependent phosphoglycerate mutase
MTSIFFVRHAQPDESCLDDRAKPLTSQGLEDSEEVTSVLSNYSIDIFISSPYKRSIDTITACAQKFKMKIHTDERFRERKRGESANNLLRRRWDDFTFCEKDGESLGEVQARNIEALKEILHSYPNMNIVIGTHGTALSTILNYYDSSFNCDGFESIWECMPYIIRCDFDNGNLIAREELLSIERGY